MPDSLTPRERAEFKRRFGKYPYEISEEEVDRCIRMQMARDEALQRSDLERRFWEQSWGVVPDAVERGSADRMLRLAGKAFRGSEELRPTEPAAIWWPWWVEALQNLWARIRKKH